MPRFQMQPDWIPFHPNPSRPRFVLPAGAVDAHCHVFGPGDTFPYAPERKYTPCDAPKEKLWALRDFLGFARNVIVQATCHGADNRALLDALLDGRGRARGIATITREVSDTELKALDAAGVRGVRFNLLKRLVDRLPTEVLRELAERVAPLGWHVVVYFEAEELPGLFDLLVSMPCPVVVDHMGRPDVTKSVAGPEFGLLRGLMQASERVWCKVTCPERLSASGPDAYEDVVPFARSVVESFPDRVLWGTDWPHPNMQTHAPDDGKLVDFILAIAPTPELQRKLLVDNPMRLYWPEELP
jgi:2-pyrone-4,6-dicarboxylate lactonase